MSVTGLILAGGQGTRMGGVEKGLQAFCGSTMIEHVIARLRPQVDALAINANRALDDYRRLALPLWSDLRSALPGPMAGLEAGLAACSTELLVAVPCDSPFLPMDLVARLRDAMAAHNTRLAYAVVDSGEERQAHPVFCLLARDMLPALRAALDRDERKLGAWLRAHNAAQAVFDDERTFCNINTREELQGFDN